MIPVMQTKFGNDGNCLAACIASLLEMDIDDVPVYLDDDTWYEQYEKWLTSKGVTVLYISEPVNGPWRISNGFNMILCGESPRGHHAVIGRSRSGSIRFVHDPHPSGDYIIGDPTSIIILIKVK